MSTTTATRQSGADVLSLTYLVAGHAWPATVTVTIHDADPDAPADGRLVSIDGLHFDNPMTSDDTTRLAGLLLRAVELTHTRDVAA